MTTPTTHPHAHILRAIADGIAVQWQDSVGRWNDQPSSNTLREIANKEYSLTRYRVKPRTITINGREVPEPERVEPPDDTPYWLPAILSEAGNNASARRWTGSTEGCRWLHQGIVHLTEEGAQAHADALLSITATKP